MPKAILEFSLPDEAWAHEKAMHGATYHQALREVDDYLRNRLKHGDPSEELREELEAIRQLIRDEVPPGWDA